MNLDVNKKKIGVMLKIWIKPVGKESEIYLKKVTVNTLTTYEKGQNKIDTMLLDQIIILEANPFRPEP